MAAYLKCSWCGTETPDADVPMNGTDLICPECGGPNARTLDMIEREADAGYERSR